MTQKLIAVCEYSGNDKTYEYLCELPDNANFDDYKYAVTATVSDNWTGAFNTKSKLNSLSVLYVREIKPITDQNYAGDLQRLVMVFTLKDFLEHARTKEKIRNLRFALEKKVAEMSIFEKIAALGVKDPTITEMADELKKLMERKF